MHFRLYKGFNFKKIAPAAGYLPSVVYIYLARRRRIFLDLKAVYKRKCVDFARRRRENFADLGGYIQQNHVF